MNEKSLWFRMSVILSLRSSVVDKELYLGLIMEAKVGRREVLGFLVWAGLTEGVACNAHP